MEFLKPTKSKMILFIISFLIFPIPVAFTNIGACPPKMENPPMTCDYGDVWKIMPLGGLFLIGALIAGGNQWFHLTSNIWEVLKIPYVIIVPYLLACLIIFIFNKFKKK